VPAHKASPIQLSAEHERELNHLVRAHSTPQKLAERARIILLAAAGLGITETARQLRIWRKTAGHWRRRWWMAETSATVAAVDGGDFRHRGRTPERCAPQRRTSDVHARGNLPDHGHGLRRPRKARCPDQSLESKRVGPTIGGPRHRQKHLARLCRAFFRKEADLIATAIG
jgi:hypothetical protein